MPCYFGGTMEIQAMIASIDGEIARLEQARSILTTLYTGSVKIDPGRPKTTTAQVPKQKKRTMSAEGRRKIAEAQRRRWAERAKAK